ncbi:MAG: histidine kinase [Bacteroidota bacterium]
MSTQAAISPPQVPLILQRSWAWDLLFWISYGLFWHLIFAPNRLTVANLSISALLTFWQAVASYVHIGWLLEPRLRGRISILAYGLSIPLLLVLVSSASYTSLYLFFAYMLPEESIAFYGSLLDYWVGAILGGMGMALAFSWAIYLLVRRREDAKRTQELEKAKVETELAYLRQQLNPHFLFNALNSIHVLIPRSPQEAQQALEGFSELLRYQLYQSEAKFVPLAQEIEQVNQYIDLSRLRLEEDFILDFKVANDLVAASQIPPMLLLPLLENAIKYSPKQGGRITGGIRVADDRIYFDLTNNIAQHIVTDPENSGIGLANIKRRLALLFPDNHRLEAQGDAENFTVHLEIPTHQ